MDAVDAVDDMDDMDDMDDVDADVQEQEPAHAPQALLAHVPLKFTCTDGQVVNDDDSMVLNCSKMLQTMVADIDVDAHTVIPMDVSSSVMRLVSKLVRSRGGGVWGICTPTATLQAAVRLLDLLEVDPPTRSLAMKRVRRNIEHDHPISTSLEPVVAWVRFMSEIEIPWLPDHLQFLWTTDLLHDGSERRQGDKPIELWQVTLATICALAPLPGDDKPELKPDTIILASPGLFLDGLYRLGRGVACEYAMRCEDCSAEQKRAIVDEAIRNGGRRADERVVWLFRGLMHTGDFVQADKLRDVFGRSPTYTDISTILNRHGASVPEWVIRMVPDVKSAVDIFTSVDDDQTATRFMSIWSAHWGPLQSGPNIRAALRRLLPMVGGALWNFLDGLATSCQHSTVLRTTYRSAVKDAVLSLIKRKRPKWSLFDSSGGNVQVLVMLLTHDLVDAESMCMSIAQHVLDHPLDVLYPALKAVLAPHVRAATERLFNEPVPAAPAAPAKAQPQSKRMRPSIDFIEITDSDSD
jgi:hypothetical protein